MTAWVRRMDRAFDAGVLGLALFTLCAHLAVGLGLSLDALLALAAAAGAAAVFVAWRRRATGGVTAGPAADADPSEPGSRPPARGARAAVLAAGAACAGGLWLDLPLPEVWGLAAVAVGFACAREILASPEPASPAAASFRRPARLLFGLAGLCAAVALCASRPDADDSFYLNLAVAAADAPAAPLLAGDTLHGVPGAPLTLPIYRVHSLELLEAGLSRLTGRPVLDVAHLWVPAVLALFLPFLLARLLRRLAPRAWLPATVVALGVLLFGGAAGHGWADFGLLRLHQGKGILLTIGLPAVVLYALDFARHGGARRFLRLAAAQVAAIGISASALWLAPLVAGPALLAGLPALRGTAAAARIALGAAASAYPLAAGLALRADTVAAFRDAAIPGPESALSSLQLAQQALRAVLGPGASAALAFFFAVSAWSFAVSTSARRLCAFSAASALLFWNPFAADWIAAQLTSAVTYWRVLWLLPMPLLVAVALTAPLERSGPSPDRRAKLATSIGCLLVFGGWLLASPRALTVSPANGVHLGAPGWKVPASEFEIARVIADAAGPGEPVLAPQRVAPWIPTLHHHPDPLVVRVEYLPVLYDILGPVELQRRMTLMRLVSGRRADPRAVPMLRSALMEDGLRVVALAKAAIRGPQLPALLRETGFQKIHENADYEVWRREPAPETPSVGEDLGTSP